MSTGRVLGCVLLACALALAALEFVAFLPEARAELDNARDVAALCDSNPRYRAYTKIDCAGANHQRHHNIATEALFLMQAAAARDLHWIYDAVLPLVAVVALPLGVAAGLAIAALVASRLLRRRPAHASQPAPGAPIAYTPPAGPWIGDTADWARFAKKALHTQ